MKKAVFILLAALLVTCCQKEEIWPFYEIWKGPQDYGQVQATRNGEVWEASAYATFFIPGKPNHFGITFTAFYPDGVVAESFGIGNIPATTGSYEIHNTKGLSGPWYDSLNCVYALMRDDVPLAIYFPDRNVKSNRIWVDEVDPVAGTIRGRFNVTFKKDINSKGKYKSTVRFRNGVFTARHWP